MDLCESFDPYNELSDSEPSPLYVLDNKSSLSENSPAEAEADQEEQEGNKKDEEEAEEEVEVEDPNEVHLNARIQIIIAKGNDVLEAFVSLYRDMVAPRPSLDSELPMLLADFRQLMNITTKNICLEAKEKMRLRKGRNNDDMDVEEEEVESDEVQKDEITNGHVKDKYDGGLYPFSPEMVDALHDALFG